MKTKCCILFLHIFMLLYTNVMHVNAQVVRQADDISWEIFNNKTTCDFNVLRTTDSIPDQVIHLDSIYTTNNSTLMDFFASRMRGYLIPPISGEYTFYFACDNTGQFWLSQDTASANAQLKNEIFSLQNDWSQNTSSQELIAGQKYYFEVLHYDTAYIDMVKLGWKIPGDTIPTVIKMPYTSSCGDGIPAKGFNIIENEIVAYPGYITSPGYILSPWNATDKNIVWHSSNDTVASVNGDGIITTISPGSCTIIGAAAENSELSDTIHMTVTDYYGPFFVKQNAIGNGHSWDDAIDLPLLTQRLQQGLREGITDIYISEGVYKPTTTIDRNKTFSLSNMRLVGGFSHTSTGIDTTHRDLGIFETILSGEIGVPDETIDNSYHVVVIKGPSVIDGISISDGRASCSTYGWIPGYYIYKPDDNGGGILANSGLMIINCKIVRNSAWNGGGGISCRGSWMDPPVVNVINTVVYGNSTQQQVYTVGGIFNIIVNGYGAGMSAAYCKVRIQGCHFSNNIATGVGGAIMYAGDTLNVEYSSFDNNPGSGSSDIFGKDGGHLNFNNVSINGNLTYFFVNSGSIYNSTINGNLAVNLIFQNKNNFIIDNSIIRGVNPDEIVADSVFEAKFCILGNSLFGASKVNLLFDSLPDHTLWLDSLAYNGGPTPTMKLKNIPGNYALNYGNPLYLYSADQRGAIRANFVSIGAYQWVDATEIVISPHRLTLTLGDSADFSVYFLPAFSSDGLYTVSSSDNNIARVDSSMIYAITTGFVNIIAQSSDGMLRDTLLCQVIDNAGIEEVKQNTQFKVFPNPVAHELTIASNGDSGNVNFEVVNAFGQVVSGGKMREKAVINVAGFLPGVYLIKFENGKNYYVVKIIKK